MRKLKSGLFFVAAYLLAAAAYAGAGTLNTTVTRLQDNVTYSTSGAKPLVTFIGYLITVQNDPTNTNTINNIVFTGTAVATGITVNETVPFSSSDGAVCAATIDPTKGTTVSCPVGQLKAGQSSTFVVFFNAPVKAPNAPTPDVVTFSGTTFYAEGTGGLDSSIPQNSTTTWPKPLDPPLDVTLGTDNPTKIRSAVPRAGGTLFTGTAGTPLADLIKTAAETSVIPALNGLKYAFAEITVNPNFVDPDCVTQGHFTQCPLFTTSILDISVQPPAPVQFPSSSPTTTLTLLYRVDASTLKMPPAKILNSTLLKYTGGPINPQTNVPRYVDALVGACSNSSVNTDPQTGLPTGLPCILSSQCYKRSTPGWTPDLDGDCEWILINSENGTLKIQ